MLAAKEREQDAERGYVEALRDYWIARAELERAVGGRLPDEAVGLLANPDSKELARDSFAERHGRRGRGEPTRHSAGRDVQI